MNIHLACILVAMVVATVVPATVEGGLLNDRLANSSIGRYLEQMPKAIKLPSLFGGKNRDPAPSQPSDQVQPTPAKTSPPQHPQPQPSLSVPPAKTSLSPTQPSGNRPETLHKEQQNSEGEGTTEKTVKLETTTHDRSIIVAPLKKCPPGQRMDPNRECRPNFVDTEDGSRK